ncbi:MAG TPA: hypothetical protein VH816_06240 [Gaiellaceae bacterium]|jgi:hypothetical protein
MRSSGRLLTALAVVAVAAAVAAIAAFASGGREQRSAADSCKLSANGQIKHLVYIQFDNTHFKRDRPNVASDLEQMPHLLGFLESNGTLFTNDHTILISHTAGGILSSLTGLYPDRNGVTVSNSYGYFTPAGTPAFTAAFKYWTSPVDGADDSKPNMITDTGKTTPAPWVPFTRAGCDVGGVGTANIELENNITDPGGDIYNVYGPGSPEALEPAAQRTTDFVGIAVHCAQTSTSKCASNDHAKDDALPDEPGGYTGYEALFGAKYVDPAITGGNECVNDTGGAPIQDAAMHCGFPGFDGMLAKNSLGYVEQMQESGVPVTYAYISDAHDNHTLFRASGPGESDYEAQLAAYDQAFQSFFQNLAAHGIDKSNTLFVVTVDEGDHYAGGTSTDGTWSHTFCNVSAGDTCPANQIGEVNLNLNSALPSGYTPPAYSVHSDSAPTVYVNGNPAPTDAALRQLERNVAAAQAIDPYVSSAPKPITEALVDTAGEKALHMVNADLQRTPNFTLFANPDYFVKTSNTNCPDAAHNVADCIDYHFAWSHGDIQEDIANTWVGFVGPGVQHGGNDAQTWTDHANVRPTILSLLGLKDDYVQDGRVLIEGLTTKATPQTLVAHRETVRRLGAVYEQLNAPFGAFGESIAKASTKALASGSASDDATYTSIEGSISSLTAKRDTLAVSIRNGLNGAAFAGKALSEQQAKGWIGQAQSLIDQAAKLAS